MKRLPSSPLGLLLMAAAALSGCAGPRGPDPLLRVAEADQGVVLEVRPIVRARPILVEAPPAAAAPAVAATAPPPIPAAATGTPVAVTAATAAAPVDLGVLVVADQVAPGEPVLGLAYTVRRASDGAVIQLAAPPGRPLSVGQRVRILYGARIRIAPAA